MEMTTCVKLMTSPYQMNCMKTGTIVTIGRKNMIACPGVRVAIRRSFRNRALLNPLTLTEAGRITLGPV